MRGGCDGTLAEEEEEHGTKSERRCENKLERDAKMSHKKKAEEVFSYFFYISVS